MSHFDGLRAFLQEQIDDRQRRLELDAESTVCSLKSFPRHREQDFAAGLRVAMRHREVIGALQDIRDAIERVEATERKGKQANVAAHAQWLEQLRRDEVPGEQLKDLAHGVLDRLERSVDGNKQYFVDGELLSGRDAIRFVAMSKAGDISADDLAVLRAAASSKKLDAIASAKFADFIDEHDDMIKKINQRKRKTA